MFHNPYDVTDVTVDFECYWDSPITDDLPDDQDCTAKWSRVFEVHEDFHKDCDGEWFESACPRCGRVARVWEASRRGYAKSVWED